MKPFEQLTLKKLSILQKWFRAPKLLALPTSSTFSEDSKINRKLQKSIGSIILNVGLTNLQLLCSEELGFNLADFYSKFNQNHSDSIHHRTGYLTFRETTVAYFLGIPTIGSASQNELVTRYCWMKYLFHLDLHICPTLSLRYTLCSIFIAGKVYTPVRDKSTFFFNKMIK